jgi:hypothetical protein
VAVSARLVRFYTIRRVSGSGDCAGVLRSYYPTLPVCALLVATIAYAVSRFAPACPGPDDKKTWGSMPVLRPEGASTRRHGARPSPDADGAGGA